MELHAKSVLMFQLLWQNVLSVQMHQNVPHALLVIIHQEVDVLLVSQRDVHQVAIQHQERAVLVLMDIISREQLV